MWEHRALLLPFGTCQGVKSRRYRGGTMAAHVAVPPQEGAGLRGRQRKVKKLTIRACGYTDPLPAQCPMLLYPLQPPPPCPWKPIISTHPGILSIVHRELIGVCNGHLESASYRNSSFFASSSPSRPRLRSKIAVTWTVNGP